LASWLDRKFTLNFSSSRTKAITSKLSAPRQAGDLCKTSVCETTFGSRDHVTYIYLNNKVITKEALNNIKKKKTW